MRFIIIGRQARQVAPMVQNKVAYWTACWDYIKQCKQDGTIEAYYWVHMLPDGLAAPTVLKNIGVINVKSAAAAQALLKAYPGHKAEGGLAFELIPVLNGEAAYLTSEKSGIGFLATGKPTLYKAPSAKDKAAFENTCSGYVQEMMDKGTIEYWAKVFAPGQTHTYAFLNVETHEELFAALYDYPATTAEEGIQWQFHTLLDSDYCFNSMLEEAKEKEG